jgi:hypothetical protein
MRSVSKACPGGPDEVPDSEVNAHPGSPCSGQTTDKDNHVESGTVDKPDALV